MRARDVGAAIALFLLGVAACKNPAGQSASVDPAPSGEPSSVALASATAIGAPRPGMIFIPSGILKAGTPVDHVPRVAGEELPWVDVPLAGFYIDELPWPNEAGAIPMANVARDDATKLCASKGKRLCTELEWERACKGPGNTLYEYGDTYRAEPCNTGLPAEEGAQLPSGMRVSCKSAFGVREMHGGIWEWTESPWGRGSARDLGTLRGGNATAGELVGRCSNGRALAPVTRSASVGFRCCDGPRNEAKVDLKVVGGQALHRAEKAAELPQAMALGCGAPIEGARCVLARAWVWRPIPNVELYIKGGCVEVGPRAKCGIVIGRIHEGKPEVIVSIDAGREPAEVVLTGDRNVRMKGAAVDGPFFKAIQYNYGKVDVFDVQAR